MIPRGLGARAAQPDLAAVVDELAVQLGERREMGIAIGAEYSVGWPMMSEFAPARLRGRLMGVTILAWYVGFMIGYTWGYVLELQAVPWRIVLETSTIISVVLVIARIGLPESPRWLWTERRFDEAHAIAHRYMESSAEMDVEHEDTHTGGFGMLLSREYWRMTVFVSWFWFCNVLPYFAIGTFADDVLETSHVAAESPSAT